MSAEIVELDANETFTVEEALARANRLAPKEIVILCVTENDEMHIYNSDNLTNADLFWMVSKASQEFL